ncbi:MAG TPA: DUF5336 domain-containing protein [Pseudonocardiaceae bacterium]|nr:DUF5336 domain-containing protein [Pseudonocardiaceae bacterium]
MSYPSGPPGGFSGQPQQQGAPVFGQPPAAPNPLGRLGIPGLLVLGTFVIALVAYFCSYGGGYGVEVLILLAGGLLAGLNLLPGGPATLPFAAVLSVVGGLAELDAVINSSGGRLTSMILILVFGLLQAVASVVALLLAHGLIKLAPRPAVPHAANYPPTGGFPGQQQQQQPPHQQQPPAQATTYMQPPPPQSTQFLQHPGQLNHPAGPPGGPGTE